MLDILIVGGGGREHALAWRAAQSQQVGRVFVAPGNGGTALEPRVHNIDISANDVAKLVEFAKSNGIGLTIVGPEIPLVLGIVDAFKQHGLRCFGPSQAAAQLEGSKAFAKDFLRRHHIPTAQYETFTETQAAIAYIRRMGAPIVVKADGLAAGKGVVVAQTEQEAIRAVTDMLQGNAFGHAGSRVVIEEFLQGEEASFIVMCDGEFALPMATSQDHKARDDADRGPNTGGMGAYSPAPIVTAATHERIMREVIEPTLRGLALESTPYTGFLYAGVMISTDGTPKVLEFNCRFGDPETQPIMMRLQSDLVTLCQAALDGKLATQSIRWDARPALGVVMAAAGYPGEVKHGEVIEGLPPPQSNLKVFHAGTLLKDKQVLTHGGRVLCVTALGESVSEAQQRAYAAAKFIHWNGAFYRHDIGYRAIARERDRTQSATSA